MKTRDERLQEWIRAEFQKTGSEPEHYPVFAEIFETKFNSILNGEKIDALDFPDQLLEEDAPEHGTVRQIIEEDSPKLFHSYLNCLNAGHGGKFAHLFALKMSEHAGDAELASQDAFDAIRGGFWNSDMSNPAYAEAYSVCIHQGRSEGYATKCAEYLLDCDLNFSRAQRYAATYEKTIEGCFAKGYPPVRAKAFAEYFTLNGGCEFAEAFARVYEERIAAGESHIRAGRYADTFLDYYQEFCDFDWEKNESNGNNDRARNYTEGDLRSRDKGFDRLDYARAFDSHCARVPRRTDQSADEWLADVEAQTDATMKERALRRGK